MSKLVRRKPKRKGIRAKTNVAQSRGLKSNSDPSKGGPIEPLIDVKTAVQNAQQYAKTFFPNITDIQLEEVEFDESKQDWRITLSFPIPDKTTFGLVNKRKYKLFLIDETGTVKSMKIREIKG